MKVSINWLKQLVDLNIPVEKLVSLLPLRTIGTKEVTDEFIELDMKGYNRADLLSMRGVAFEVAAITGSKVLFNEPDEAKYGWNLSDLPKLDATVQDSQLCPFYCLAKIEGLKVDFSSPETVERLEASGMRSVNNIADETNMIMLEYGQPLHAFDISKVQDEKIIVRLARAGEELKTLDGKTRKLHPTNLVIADSQKPLGVAGVMGGLNSEVTRDTNTILLEAAIFNPVNIRKTTSQLGLPSEASKRFQHGLTKKRLLQALDAAIKAYEKIGGKLTGFVMIGDPKEDRPVITLNQNKANSLIGIEISPEQIQKYLKDLHFELAPNNNSWEVKPPYWRLDIGIQEDVIEEVARMYGYEKIPSKPLEGQFPKPINQILFNTIDHIKQSLVQQGLTEVQTYSFYSTKVLDSMGWYKDNNLQYLVKIANPISSETEYLRMNVWPNLVEVIDRNIRQGFQDIAIFEVGKAYSPNKSDLPTEDFRLAIALMNGTDNPIEELLGIVTLLGERHEAIDLSKSERPKALGNSTKNSELADRIPSGLSPNAYRLLSKLEIQPNQLQGIGKELFHPTRHADIFKDGKQIGGLAEVHPRLINKLGIEKRVAILEIYIDPY